jgi:hypothetical protein
MRFVECGGKRREALLAGASRDVSSNQRGGHMMADRGLPKPRSPHGRSGILLPAGKLFCAPCGPAPRNPGRFALPSILG